MRLRVAIAALGLAGAGIAAYLTSTHYAGTAPICTSGGCEKVQSSSYSELAGVPVALLGLLAYVGVIATAAVRGSTPALAAAFLALVGTAFSGYLLWAQLARIHAICVWCVSNDGVIVVLAVLCCIRFLREPQPG